MGIRVLIIPAIDLRQGHAVRALSGLRQEYQPLSTPLCPDGDACTLVDKLLALYPFPVCYLADLDAIESTGRNDHHVARLLKRFPHVTFWLDAGFARTDDFAPWRVQPNLRPVLGSESQSSLSSYAEIAGTLADSGPILSLDFRNGRFLGPASLLAHHSEWTEDVIVMELDRVGTNGGPAASAPPLYAESPSQRFHAAGGVRDVRDAGRLRDLGYAGVLVASALHAGRIHTADIRALAAGEP